MTTEITPEQDREMAHAQVCGLDYVHNAAECPDYGWDEEGMFLKDSPTTVYNYTDRGETHRITAVKTLATRKGNKFKVVIHIDDQPAIEMGGNRSERAQAVLISQWYEGTKPGCYGVRGDLAKAQAEAAATRSPNRKVHGSLATPPKFFVAVPVTLDPSVNWDATTLGQSA